jgi:hypothetical protein
MAAEYKGGNRRMEHLNAGILNHDVPAKRITTLNFVYRSTPNFQTFSGFKIDRTEPDFHTLPHKTGNASLWTFSL